MGSWCVKPQHLVSGSYCYYGDIRSAKEVAVVFICCSLPRQEAEIDSIHQLVVGATENIKEGNEDIREVGTLGAPCLIWRGAESRQ